jgi:protoporphyrinogen/coproporphyrinogen III oxidase
VTLRPLDHVVVIGAGLSGLACAHRLRERNPELRVTILEAGARAGGWVGTDSRDGFLIERGADGFLDEKPAARLLARSLGIEDRMVGTNPSPHGSAIVHRGRLEPIPEGFSIMAPTRLRPFLRSKLVSPLGKARALLEPFVPRGPASRRGEAATTGGQAPDESLASFVRRRFGREVATRLAQPLAGGIYGADPEILSLRATMPRFLNEEAESGSVTLGLRRKAKAQGQVAKGARYQLFQSFDRGMQVLVDTLVAAVPPIQLGIAALAVTESADGVQVATTEGVIDASAVVLAVDARTSAKLLGKHAASAPLAAELSQLTFGSAATVAFALRSSDLPATVRGYGFVVPSTEGRSSIAATYLSRKWPNRTPVGFDLVRIFLGGPSSPPFDAPEDVLVDAAFDELVALVGVRPSTKPLFHVVNRALGAMPQYHVGHLERVRRVDELLEAHPRLAVAGNSLRGVGIPDTILAGQRAADALSGHAAK